MSKGFTIADQRRAERDAVEDVPATDDQPYQHNRFMWAVSNRPGAVPIGGGRKQRQADHLSAAYGRFKEAGRRHQGHRKFDMAYKLGRFTPPAGGVFPKPGPSALAAKRQKRRESQ